MADESASDYFTIEVKGHGSNLLNNLNRARLEEKFCDFIIQVGNQIIHAHKIVLAEGCDYFRAMLSHPMKEANEGIVEMADVDFECLEICVEYIYLGKITVMKEKLQSLLEVAHRLQLNELCEEASNNLEGTLSLDTFFAIKSVATSLDLKPLEKKCDGFALENFSEIVQVSDFLETESKYVQFLMTAEVPPAVKCKAFLLWANHDVNSRRKEFEEFFLNLDLQKLPPSYMTFLEQNEPLFFNSAKCLRKLMQLKITIGSGRDISFDTFREEREFSRFAVFDKTSRTIQAYDPDKKTWTELHKFVSEVSELRFTASVVGEDIFVFTYDQRSWKLRYSDQNSTWYRLPNRSVTKKVEAVEVDGLIYAFDESKDGGKAVELYNGSKWSHVTDKPVAGWQTYIVAAEDSIYCIGGHDGMTNYYSHCNKYETRKKCWSSLPSMPEERSCGCAAKLSRKIYVIGGFNNSNTVLKTGLVFDIEIEGWSEIPGMAIPRCNFRAVSIAGKIFSIGGAKSGNTVEEFDPVAGRWRTVLNLSGKEILATSSVAL